MIGWALLPLSPQERLDARIPIDIVDWTQEDFDYADFVIDLFTNFVKYGWA